ncbi:uncharacterized protein LOC143561344 [Bidens hawaiensis]|uniref:uncharacterized protein LOC143561344 n=1 Tax=Bidens hawaiensis TaxID=980011 RepID=UPI00404B2A6F
MFHKSIFFLIFITFISSSHANTFQVGGKDGWTLHPSESYNSWSNRLRFLINDTLHFKYDGGSDSVLVVNKGDYDGCNANNPITKLEGGDSTFKFDRSGPFYFISGNKSNCDQGQKLIVVVLALRIRSPPPSIATPPSSSTMPPSPGVATPLPPSVSPVLPPTAIVSPVSPPSTAVSPVYSPTMSPVSPPSIAGAPNLSPAGTPTVSPPADSPAGGTADSSSGGSTVSPGGGTTGPGGEPTGSPGQGGSGGSSPGRNSLGAMPPLSGTMITLFVTVMFGFVAQLMI